MVAQNCGINFFTENLTTIFVQTCCAASKLVERSTLNEMFVLSLSCSSRCRSPFHLTFLLLSGDIEFTPRPSNFTLCTRGIDLHVTSN